MGFNKLFALLYQLSVFKHTQKLSKLPNGKKIVIYLVVTKMFGGLVSKKGIMQASHQLLFWNFYLFDFLSIIET